MSCIGLGQAAQVDKLICTNLDITGVATTSAFVYGTALAPINMTVSPTITIGNVTRVTIYGYNTTVNNITFILSLPTPGVRNHSFTVTAQQINVIGGAVTDDAMTSCGISPFTTSTGNLVLISCNFAVPLLVSLNNAQRINVLIISD